MNELIKYTLDLLKVLSDKTRLEILHYLNESPRSSKDLQKLLSKKQPSISQQLKILYSADLITFYTKENRKKKKIKYYKLKDDDIVSVLSSIKSYVAKVNNEKMRNLQDLDIIDTLS